MKKLFVLLLLLVFVSAIHAQATPAAQLAHHIADKMKDSLGLTNQQRAKLFQINMDLFDKKTGARKKSKDRTIIGPELQQVEKTRDGLYKEVLTQQQYLLYLQKKRHMITAN